MQEAQLSKSLSEGGFVGDSGREEASPVAGGQPPFPRRGELQDCLHIITGEFGELTEKLVRRHSSPTRYSRML